MDAASGEISNMLSNEAWTEVDEGAGEDEHWAGGTISRKRSPNSFP